MPRGARLFKLVVKRVRGSKKGTSYTRKFRTQADLNAAKARYAKLGKSRIKPESKAGRKAAEKAMKTPMSQRGIKEATAAQAKKAGFSKDSYPRNIWKNPPDRLNTLQRKIQSDFGSLRESQLPRWKEEIKAIRFYNPKLKKVELPKPKTTAQLAAEILKRRAKRR